MTDDFLRMFAETWVASPDMVSDETRSRHETTVAMAKRFLELLPPADDGEPTTKEWLEANGFRLVNRWFAHAREVSEQVDVGVTPTGKVFIVYGNQAGSSFVWFPRTGCTRGDVRRLVAILSSLGVRPVDAARPAG